MGKKRYYYDSKGRSRGHSSDQSPQARNLGALLIGLPIILALGMCSRVFGDEKQKMDSSSVHEQSVKQETKPSPIDAK